MPFTFKLSKRLALLKASLPLAVAALAACERPLQPVTGPTSPVVQVVAVPDTTTLDPYQTQQFVAYGRTQVGDSVAVAVRWIASAGTVTAAGVYTADTIPGTYQVTATATAAPVSGSAQVKNRGPLRQVIVTPAAAVVSAKGGVQFAAYGRRANGDSVAVSVVWSATGGSISAAGLYTAGPNAGTYQVTATQSGGALAATAATSITTVPVASVTVSPASASILVGGTQQFTAVTKDAAGNILTGRIVTWSTSNASVATVSGSGLGTGIAAGPATITATSEGQSGGASLTVSNVPVASVTVSPASASVLVGATQQFTAVTKDAAGNVLTGRLVTWSSSNTLVATVSGSGLALAIAAGPATITATSEGKSGTASLTVQLLPPPPGTVPDPTLLPVASAQAPNVAAYNALNVPGQPAGFSYNDPTTSVKVWKVTSSTVPAPNTGAGHDYADGPNQVSLGWGANNDTHTILIRGDGMAYYLVDFTRGVGFSNYRLLTVQPRMDCAATFSSVAGQERILYIMTNSQLVRYNTATMSVQNTGYFPLSQTFQTWLQQDKNDVWFVGMVNATTAFAWNSQTNQYLTDGETWLNEPRLERDGRYVVLTSGTGTVRVWDLSNNTLGPVQSVSSFFHNADLRGQWVHTNTNFSAPFGQVRQVVSGGALSAPPTTILLQSAGAGFHQAGNWVQSDADLGGDLTRQWSFISGFNYSNPSWESSLLWQEAIGVQRSDGSDRRLLLHHYDPQIPLVYFSLPFGMPSPDGKVVIFNSNMNGSGRYDLFVAEVPLR